MNIQNLDPIVKEQFLSLPSKVQDLITESNWQDKVREIVKKNNLQIDQGGVVEDELFLVMLGFEDSKDFIPNLIKEAGLTEGVARQVGAEVSERIFTPLKNALIESTMGLNDAAEDDLEYAPETSVLSSDIAPQEQTILEPDPIAPIAAESVESRDEILSQIENPVKTETQLVKNTQVTATPVITKPLTAPIAPTQPKPARVDPYREPIS